MIYGYNSVGPIAHTQKYAPATMTSALRNAARKYLKWVFVPTKIIPKGLFKNSKTISFICKQQRHIILDSKPPVAFTPRQEVLIFMSVFGVRFTMRWIVFLELSGERLVICRTTVLLRTMGKSCKSLREG